MFLALTTTLFFMGVPPHRAILPVASLGVKGTHSISPEGTSHWSPVNSQLHQAPVNQASGDQALGNLSSQSIGWPGTGQSVIGHQSPVNQAPVNQALGNKSLVNRTPGIQALGDQSPVIWYQVSITGYQSPVIQTLVVIEHRVANYIKRILYNHYRMSLRNLSMLNYRWMRNISHERTFEINT